MTVLLLYLFCFFTFLKGVWGGGGRGYWIHLAVFVSAPAVHPSGRFAR